MGLPRIAYGFSAGVVLFRIRDRLRLPAVPGWAILVATTAMLEVPMPAMARPFFDLAAVTLVAPALVAFGSRATPPAWSRRSVVFLAETSYPLYAVHVPLMLWVTALAGYMPIPVTAFALLGMAATVVLSYALAIRYDRPLRQALGTLSAPRRAKAPA